MTPESDFSSEEMEVLREIFLASSSEYLARAGTVLEAWTVAGIEEPRLKDLHRAIHSVKGAALQLGYLPIGTLARSVELVLLAALAGRPAGWDRREAVAQGCAALGAQVEALRARAELAPPDPELLDRLAQLAGGTGAAGRADSPGVRRAAGD